ncbi:MAG: hypothetical protein Q9220_006686 [cf. Caloplaca sp. 1 TL-2023]
MDDELVTACLPAFRDDSLDSTEQLEQVQLVVQETSPLTGEGLEQQILRIALRCREVVKTERTRRIRVAPNAETQSSPLAQGFQFSPIAAEFLRQSVPTPLTPEQEHNRNQIRAFENLIANLDSRISHFQSDIIKYKHEIQRLRRESDANIDAHLATVPDRTMTSGYGMHLMRVAMDLRRAGERLQNVVQQWEGELQQLRRERNECYERRAHCKYMDLPG